LQNCFGEKELYKIGGVSPSYRPSEKNKTVARPMTKKQMKEFSPELYQIINELEDLEDIDLDIE